VVEAGLDQKAGFDRMVEAVHILGEDSLDNHRMELLPIEGLRTLRYS
jgi:hypothetical protein